MNDRDDPLRSELGLALPTTSRATDWDDVVRRAQRGRLRRAGAVVALTAVGLALGATALAETIGHGFSDWLRGTPGTPASSAEQERFRTQNERSAAPLAAETDLRELMRVEHGGRTYTLVGLRTGGAVCLRLEGTDVDEGGDLACVAADELERSQDLAVPLKVDAPLHEIRPGDPPSDQATFGLVAEETRRVVLAGDDGRREAMVANGAFLSISAGPVREHTTLKAFAFDARGVSHPVLLAPSLTDETQQFRTGLPLRGPANVERTVRGGGIGWLDRRERRGEPLPEGLLAQTLVPPSSFGRVILPDPDDFLRIVVAVPEGEPDQICFALVMRGGVGSSCASGPAAFARRPFTTGWTYAGSGSQFVTATGMATDEVERLVLFLGTGENRAVALRDNVFLARVARAKFPVRLVAYDAAGRVIGVDAMLSF